MLSQLEIARHVGGKFFRVVFTKRTDGSVRVMRARLGVHKHLSGGGAKYNFASKNLLSVWDLDARGYRCVPLDAIMEFRCGPVYLTEDGRLAREDLRDLQPDDAAERRPRPEERSPRA